MNSTSRTVRLIAGRWLVALSTIGAAWTASGCDQTDGPGSGTGEIRVQMVDAPADVQAVFVAVTKIEVHTAGSADADGWVTVSDQPAMYDLLSLRNGSTALVAAARIRAAHYTQIRLTLGTGSYVVVNGAPVSLEIASGFETGVKLVHQFTIEEDQTYEITLDFDAEASLQPTAIGFRLRPVIRIYVNQTSGSIAGTVMPASARARVTAMAGSDTVTSTVCDTTGGFRFAVIPEGTYQLGIRATSGVYRDTVLSNVVVTRRQEKNVGTITLSPGPALP